VCRQLSEPKDKGHEFVEDWDWATFYYSGTLSVATITPNHLFVRLTGKNCLFFVRPGYAVFSAGLSVGISNIASG
jgi:hypothetical protein